MSTEPSEKPEAVPPGITRRVWVLPNANTMGLGALLLAIWYAAASQGNGAAYLLGFVITAIAAVSTVHTWANLRGIELSADTTRPAFADDELTVPLTAKSARQREHVGVRISAGVGGQNTAIPGIGPKTSQRVELRVPARQRGIFDELPVRLSSVYPLGFFSAASHAIVRTRIVVYPKPEGNLPLPRSAGATRGQRDGLRSEGDDFAGVRAYRVGESQRHIDWKAVSRGQPLLVKQWAGDASETVMLDWQDVLQLGYEMRLRQLARWIVAAERGGTSYGLRIPGLQISPNRGEAHFHRCLLVLAEFPSETGTRSQHGGA